MKNYSFTRLMLIMLVISMSLTPIACGSDDPDPIMVKEDPKADPTNASTTIVATSSVIANGVATSEVTITLADSNGNPFTSSGGTVALVSTGDASISAVTDNSNGTYSATVTNTTAETVTLSGTLAGSAITDTAEVIFDPIPDAEQSLEPVGPSIVRINCGGPEVTFGDVTFAAENFNQIVGPSLAFENEFLTEIDGTDFDELFFTERVTQNDSAQSPFSYKIPVANGTYTVKLYWAEVYWGLHPNGIDGGIGSRIFSVTMEDTPIINNIDLFAELGTANADTRMYDIEVMDEELTITFQSTADRPKISAIEIFAEEATIIP